jgi:catechol 2,3-dioxygenase-like lactoylglutathione lyase family enzyme
MILPVPGIDVGISTFICSLPKSTPVHRADTLHFEVADFDRVITTLDHERVHVASGPGVRPHDNTRYVFVHDPDGNLIEIVSPE